MAVAMVAVGVLLLPPVPPHQSCTLMDVAITTVAVAPVLVWEYTGGTEVSSKSQPVERETVMSGGALRAAMCPRSWGEARPTREQSWW